MDHAYRVRETLSAAVLRQTVVSAADFKAPQRAQIEQQGYTINPVLRSQGDVHAVMIDDGGWRTGWSDGRRGGHALGY